MELSAINSEKEYKDRLDWADQQFAEKVQPDSLAGKKLEMALVLIKNHEDQHYPTPHPGDISPN